MFADVCCITLKITHNGFVDSVGLPGRPFGVLQGFCLLLTLNSDLLRTCLFGLPHVTVAVVTRVGQSFVAPPPHYIYIYMHYIYDYA